MAVMLADEQKTESTDGLSLGGFAEVRPGRSRLRRVLIAVFGTIAGLALVLGIAGFVYWRTLQDTPQYSLALIVDSARRDDQQTIESLVDTDALVDDFMPQVTAKAIELYGRGVPPETLARVGRIAQPLIPAVKERARAEIPELIRNKTERFKRVPFGAMVIGADRYLNIDGDERTAVVSSKLPEHSFEVTMERSGNYWKIVGVRDDVAATRLARAVGQEIIGIAANGGLESTSENSLGVANLSEILREAEEIFK